MLSIGLIAALVYLFTTTQKNKQIALQKGVEEDNLTFFAISLWFYAFPPIAAFLFVQDYSVLIALVFVAFYIPGIVLSSKLSKKLGTGFDYERKAGKEFYKAMWLGFAGIGVVVFNWMLSGTSSMLKPR